MFDPDHNASPFNNVPGVVVALVAAIALVELVFQLGAFGLIGGPRAVGWRTFAISQFSFSDPVFEYMLRNSYYAANALWRFVTYAFLHVGAVHAVFAAVLLLAIGKFVAERFSGVAVLVIFFAGTVVGAMAYGVLLDEQRQLIGAYPGIYALIGALTWWLFMAHGEKGENRLRAFQLIGVLLALQLVFGAIGGGGKDWVADIAGFAAGFALSFLFGPGGGIRLKHALDRSRNR